MTFTRFLSETCIEKTKMWLNLDMALVDLRKQIVISAFGHYLLCNERI